MSYKLAFCQACFSMTNHSNGCLRCKLIEERKEMGKMIKSAAKNGNVFYFEGDKIGVRNY